MRGPNPEYEGYVVSATHLTGSVPGKFYQVDIRGREHPDVREWSAQSDLDVTKTRLRFQRILEQREEDLIIPRVVISFPHVTRLYWPDDPDIDTSRETNWDTALYSTTSLEDKGRCGVGCDGELAILSAESWFWNRCSDVEDYLGMFVPIGSLGRVSNTNKLYEFKRRHV